MKFFHLHTAEYTSEKVRIIDSPTYDDELPVSPEWPDGYDTITPPPILTQFNSTPQTLRIRYLTRPTSPGYVDRAPEVQEVHPISLKSPQAYYARLDEAAFAAKQPDDSIRACFWRGLSKKLKDRMGTYNPSSMSLQALVTRAVQAHPSF